jgi:tungstate transport system substrate-binding protein
MHSGDITTHLVADGVVVLKQIVARGAYCIVGSLPVRTGRMPRKEMITMVEGDPSMRRPFILILANPRHFPATNHAGTVALAAFLLKPDTQKFISTFGKGINGSVPFFFPVAEEAQGFSDLSERCH